MSHISIHRLDDIARKRIGRTAQVAALPPQPARLEADFWHLTRRPFVHARGLHMMSFSVGKDAPAIAKLQADVRVQAFVTANFPDFSLEQFLISPELPSEIADSINTYTATLDPSALSASQLSLYKRTGLSTSLPLIIPDGEAMIAGRMYMWEGPSQPAPCIIKSIQSYHAGATQFGSFVGSVDGYGTIWTNTGNAFNANFDLGGGGNGLDLWVLTGSVTPRIEGTVFIDGSINTSGIHVNCELLAPV